MAQRVGVFAAGKKQNMTGMMIVALSGISFGMMPLLTGLAKDKSLGGSNSYMLVFFRFFIGAILLLAILLLKNRRFPRICAKDALRIFILSVPEALTPLFLYMSYDYISPGITMTVHFAYPIIVMAVSCIFLKEHFSPFKLLCGIMCTFGVVLTCNFTATASNPLPGIILALLSAFSYATYIILIDRVAPGDMDPLARAFWMSLMISGEIALAALPMGKLNILSLRPVGWLCSVALAFIATAIGAVLFQVGTQMCGAQNSALLSVLEPFTSIVLELILVYFGVGELFGFSMSLTLPVGIGMALILASPVLLVVNERKTEVKNAKNETQVGRVEISEFSLPHFGRNYQCGGGHAVPSACGAYRQRNFGNVNASLF